MRDLSFRNWLPSLKIVRGEPDHHSVHAFCFSPNFQYIANTGTEHSASITQTEERIPIVASESSSDAMLDG